jgi:hypothetical protein
MLAAVEKPDLQPCEAAAIEGTHDKYSECSQTGNPCSCMSRPAPQKKWQANAGHNPDRNPRSRITQEPGRSQKGRCCGKADEYAK